MNDGNTQAEQGCKNADVGAAKAAACEWSRGEYYWETTCQKMHFEFCDGGPKDNEFKFCPGCGLPLVEISVRHRSRPGRAM